MLDILIALGAGIGGAVCGWVIRPSFSKTKLPITPPAELPPETEPASDSEDSDPDDEGVSQKSVYEIAERLRNLSLRIAADVDEHQSRVQQVNMALTDGDSVPDPDAVVDAVTALIQSNETMQAQLQEAQQRIQDQAEQIQTAEERAVTDALTKIRNRRAFDDFLENCYANRHDRPSTLMLMDVDHFKKFNDDFGHLAGDEVLRIVAGILNARLGESGLVARYGGEEFAAVFEGRDLQSCREIVETARRAIGEREVLFEGQRLRVTASLGLAQLDSEEALEEWVERVDQGLYKAKEMGRNRGYWMDGEDPKPLIDEAKNNSGSAAQKKASPQAKDSADSRAAEPTGRRAADAATGSNDWDDDLQLHRGESLRVIFDQMSERLGTVGVSFFLMIVRSDRSSDQPAHRQDVLKNIRAATRSLDQVGVLDNGDFVVCMPSVKRAAAIEKAHAIREGVEHCSHSDMAGPTTVSIGLSQVHEEDSYEAMLEAAGDAASEAAEAGGNRLVIAPLASPA